MVPVMQLNERFRGYLPIVVDLETGGFDLTHNPILEVACGLLYWEDDQLSLEAVHAWSVEPFADSQIDPASLKVTGIDLDDPARDAQDEKFVLGEFFKLVRQSIKLHNCQRAIMVAHNAAFDRSFLDAACTRQGVNRNPFHPFSTLDTASIAAVAYGHTVLAEVCRRAGITFEGSRAHSAAYDVECTAKLFCDMVNRWPIDPASWAPAPRTGKQ